MLLRYRAGCAVLGISGIVESYSLWVAVRSVSQGAQAAGLTFWEFVKRGMDPTSIAVMMEDGAAVTGLAIAGIAPPCSSVLLPIIPCPLPAGPNLVLVCCLTCWAFSHH